MDALGIFKFWRNTAAGADVSSEVDDVRNSSFGGTDEETDDDDSLFDLAFKSPDRGAAKTRDEDLKKDYRFIESPRDVFLSKNEFSSPKPQSPVTILRSAPKFKVFMLGFKKSSKCEKTEPVAASPVNQLSKPSKLEQSNRFSAKSGPAVGPFLARDNSLRSKMLKDNCDYEASSDVVSAEKSVPKYLKLIKPFYVKASSKAKSTDSVTPSSSPVTAPVNLSPRKFCEVSRVGSFKIMTRNLVKSRSASAADGAAPPSIRRRDDSLLEQHDGIQGAILHCKRSYTNSSYREFSHLCRAASDTSHEKLRRNSCEEQKRCSI
ncbi:probable membrane-associated kinase regulator 2 [Phtheirospermum japonicum]|uniref:Probable membrane-associated kinase regulator 2 n=1 Tax=Phtheirospermum japonicum TaxID=374723 RepID=A0A830BAJ4_9LAMI|nr:probable membrane-associated kinase regulator 2 [Phtheirospermum japonicum]